MSGHPVVRIGGFCEEGGFLALVAVVKAVVEGAVGHDDVRREVVLVGSEKGAMGQMVAAVAEALLRDDVVGGEEAFLAVAVALVPVGVEMFFQRNARYLFGIADRGIQLAVHIFGTVRLRPYEIDLCQQTVGGTLRDSALVGGGIVGRGRVFAQVFGGGFQIVRDLLIHDVHVFPSGVCAGIPAGFNDQGDLPEELHDAEIVVGAEKLGFAGDSFPYPIRHLRIGVGKLINQYIGVGYTVVIITPCVVRVAVGGIVLNGGEGTARPAQHGFPRAGGIGGEIDKVGDDYALRFHQRGIYAVHGKDGIFIGLKESPLIQGIDRGKFEVIAGGEEQQRGESK
ncbi:hypothetical protein Barb7_03072 [Bacteroidales bacterium Barb7]|nr:hypothetical protein Barb7_03072 [Bacteroidales bacterium Barb7]